MDDLEFETVRLNYVGIKSKFLVPFDQDNTKKQFLITLDWSMQEMRQSIENIENKIEEQDEIVGNEQNNKRRKEEV